MTQQGIPSQKFSIRNRKNILKDVRVKVRSHTGLHQIAVVITGQWGGGRSIEVSSKFRGITKKGETSLGPIN